MPDAYMYEYHLQSVQCLTYHVVLLFLSFFLSFFYYSNSKCKTMEKQHGEKKIQKEFVPFHNAVHLAFIASETKSKVVSYITFFEKHMLKRNRKTYACF